MLVWDVLYFGSIRPVFSVDVQDVFKLLGVGALSLHFAVGGGDHVFLGLAFGHNLGAVCGLTDLEEEVFALIHIFLDPQDYVVCLLERELDRVHLLLGCRLGGDVALDCARLFGGFLLVYRHLSGALPARADGFEVLCLQVAYLLIPLSHLLPKRGQHGLLILELEVAVVQISLHQSHNFQLFINQLVLLHKLSLHQLNLLKLLFLHGLDAFGVDFLEVPLLLFKILIALGLPL